MKRMRRNGENWKVLTSDAQWRSWTRGFGLTIPAPSFEEAMSSARRLVIENETKGAFVIAPSGMFAAMVSDYDPSQVYTRSEEGPPGFEFVAHGYALALWRVTGVDRNRYPEAFNVEVDEAVKRANMQWRSAIREDRIPVRVRHDQTTVAAAIQACPQATLRRSFTAVGLKRSLHFRPGGADAEPAELSAISPQSVDELSLTALLLGDPQSDGLCMLEDAVAHHLWTVLTGNAFRDMPFSPGFE